MFQNEGREIRLFVLALGNFSLSRGTYTLLGTLKGVSGLPGFSGAPAGCLQQASMPKDMDKV